MVKSKVDEEVTSLDEAKEKIQGLKQEVGVYTKVIDDMLAELHKARKVLIAARILVDNYWPKKPVESFRHVRLLREALLNWESTLLGNKKP